MQNFKNYSMVIFYDDLKSVDFEKLSSTFLYSTQFSKWRNGIQQDQNIDMVEIISHSSTINNDNLLVTTVIFSTK